MSSQEARRLGMGGAQVHVGRQPARVYRDALRERGISLDATAPAAREVLDAEAMTALEPILAETKLDEWASVRALERLLARAEPVEERITPELWATVDEHGFRVSARVIRWGAHVAVIGLTTRAAEDVSLDGASWTGPALEQYARSRGAGISRAQAEAELCVSCHLAEPVDVATQPEKWRARGRLDGLDVSLAVNVVDREGARLVVAAEARTHNARRGRR